MAILTTDLVAGVRSRANVERTRFVTDDEIVVWLNDEGSEFHGKLIASRENYITRKSQFTLGSTVFTSRPDEPAVNGFTVTVNSLLTDLGLPIGGLLAAPSYYEILAFIGEPQSSCTTGDTSFTIKINTVPTSCKFVVPSGSSEVSTDSIHNLTFTAADTVHVAVSAGAGADWNIAFYLIVRPFFAETFTNASPLPSDFLKPVALSLDVGSGVKEPVLPLDNLNERIYCERWKHWIEDQRIYVFPENSVKSGPYELTYCPRWTDLQISPWPNALMREMEQFREIIELGAASMVKYKRKMIEDAEALKRKQADMIKSAIDAIPGRRGGPKHIPMPTKDRARNGSNMRNWRY